MSDWLYILLIMLTVYRATRLLTADTFPPIEAARDRIKRRFGDDSSITYLSTCPWCMSVWLGAAIVALTDLVVGVPAPVLVWAASSAVTGLIASVEPD